MRSKIVFFRDFVRLFIFLHYLCITNLKQTNMAFCTQCGQALMPGQKFCTRCGKKVPEAMVTPPTPSQVVTPPAPSQVMTPPAPPSTRAFDSKAANQKGAWVAASWDIPSLSPTSPTPLLTRIKDFFIAEHKLAYAWFLLPFIVTHFTMVSYVFHLIGKLFS